MQEGDGRFAVADRFRRRIAKWRQVTTSRNLGRPG